MSGRRTFGGLLGALSDRLQGRTRAKPGTSGESGAADPEPTTAQRLDEALDGLRRRIPKTGDEGSQPPASASGDQGSEPPASASGDQGSEPPASASGD